MQYEPQTPLRTPPPVFCPSCGSGLAAATAACAVCGDTSLVATFNTTLNLGTSSEQSRPNPGLRTFTSVPSNRLLPPQAAWSCGRCNAKLGPGAKFCRSCGDEVGVRARPRSKPLRENVVPMPQPAPEPEPEPQDVRPPGRRVSVAYLADELDDGLPPPKLQDIDYLDAVLGLRASGILPAPQPPPPPWRSGYQLVSAQRARDVSPEDSDEPVPASRERRNPQPSDSPSLAVSGAVGFAVVALGIAVVIYYFAPGAMPGYSAAEFDLKVQTRVVEWLLAGILAGIVGLLLKR